MLYIISLTSTTPTYTQVFDWQRGFDGKSAKYISGEVYVFTFSLAKLITFEDFNYASMYPMCVPCQTAINTCIR